FTRDQPHDALAPELHRRTHLLRISRVVVSALGALRRNDLPLLGNVFHHGVTERGVGDPRRRDALVVHRGRAVAAQVMVHPTTDARACVEAGLRTRPPLKAALAGKGLSASSKVSFARLRASVRAPAGSSASLARAYSSAALARALALAIAETAPMVMRG